MSNPNRNHRGLVVRRNLMLLFGFAILTVGGCESPNDATDGEIINGIVLPTDVVLNLACANVGINGEQCVLGDPENPYVTTAIIEFNVNDPDATNKFDLFNEIPAEVRGKIMAILVDDEEPVEFGKPLFKVDTQA